MVAVVTEDMSTVVMREAAAMPAVLMVTTGVLTVMVA